MLNGTVRGGLGDGAELGGRRILPLGETVNLVVEEDYVDIYVAADGVEEVIASDSESITVSAGLPYGQGRVCYLDAGADCGSPAVYAVEAVGLHTVWKAG